MLTLISTRSTRSMWTETGHLPQDQWLGGPSELDRDEWAAVMIFSDSYWIEYSATAVCAASSESNLAPDLAKVLR